MRASRCGTGESTGNLMLFKFYIIDTPTFISGYLIFYILPFHHLFKILVSEENPVMECLWLSWIIYQGLSGLKCFQFKIEAMKNATNKPDNLRNFLEDIMLNSSYRGGELTGCSNFLKHVPYPICLIKHKYKDLIIKNFKMATTEYSSYEGCHSDHRPGATTLIAQSCTECLCPPRIHMWKS